MHVLVGTLLILIGDLPVHREESGSDMDLHAHDEIHSLR